MKNHGKRLSTEKVQIKALTASIKKFGDYDGSRKARIEALKATVKARTGGSANLPSESPRLDVTTSTPAYR